MTFKNLLVHVDGEKPCGARLETAIKLARDHEAHLTTLYVLVDPSWPGYVRAQLPEELLAVQERQHLEHAKAVEQQVVEAVGKSGLSADHRTERAIDAAVAEVVALHARYADMAILGQEDPDAGTLRELPAHVLLAAGRPALIVPYIGAGDTLGVRIAVAWDAGREAARAVSDALPLLTRAKSVLLLTINPRSAPHGQEPGADIALQLARHGVKVEVQHSVSDELDPADTILSRLADHSSDLLVMGAYGHSRLRELLLGGVTRHILDHMTVPVFMSH